MFDPMDLMAQFLDPTRLGGLARKEGLTLDQATAAVGALVPAIGAAMRRRAADPRGLAEMMGLVKPKPDFAASMPGGEALGRLFGSRELTAALIDQIAKGSGVDKKTLEIMLPLATEATMATYAENLKSHPLTEGLGALFEPKPRAAPTLDEILTDTLGPNASRLVGRTLKETPNPLGPTNLFGEVLGEFLRGFNNGGPPIDETPAPEDVVPHPSRVVDRLFEAGRDAQAEQARALEAIFDRYWKDRPDAALTGTSSGGG